MTLPAEQPLPGLVEEHPELAGYPPAPEALPPQEIVEGSYSVRFARTRAELDELLRLRFRVFNLELSEGLEESYLTGRDFDRFDPQCHHLVVHHRPSGRIIGTYRIQTTQMAERADGFYTGTEFDLSRLPREILDEAVEVGRACIEREHRLKPVLFLLWKGLARYMEHNRRRWLLGPCSLTSQDPWDGKRALDLLVRRDKVRDDLWVGAQPGYECVWEGDDPEPAKGERLELPPLFEIYLRYAGRVVGPPVIDRDFKTIDFFVLFDVEALSERARRLFFG
ncbi:MAG: GNAT family N-acetyltransferase [Acidobacteria bacterium]|nr:GNAT family N-acetyltransferase [Acidobacteriota bacterium]